MAGRLDHWQRYTHNSCMYIAVFLNSVLNSGLLLSTLWLYGCVWRVWARLGHSRWWRMLESSGWLRCSLPSWKVYNWRYHGIAKQVFVFFPQSRGDRATSTLWAGVWWREVRLFTVCVHVFLFRNFEYLSRAHDQACTIATLQRCCLESKVPAADVWIL